MTQTKHSTRNTFTFSFFAFALGLMIATLIANRNESTADANDALLSFYGSDISLSDLPIEVSLAYDDMAQEHFNQQSAFLEGVAIQLEIEKYAAKHNIDEQSARQQLFNTTPPSEQVIADFYEKNKAQIKQPFFEIKEDIKRYLTDRQEANARHTLIDRLKKEGNLAILLPEIKSPSVDISTEGYPTKGDANAPIHIVEFADYQCPHCRHASTSLDALIERFAGKIKLTYMDFPINRSGISRKVAEGAVCADQQQQFWAYHDAAFQGQLTLTNESPKLLAESLGLDISAFDQCLQSEAATQKVKQAEQQAIKLGISSTPTLFINGKKYTGRNLEDALTETIDKILKSKNQ